jgi:hypothetical protein
MAGIFDIQKHVRELKIVPNPQNALTTNSYDWMNNQNASTEEIYYG